MYKYKLPPIHMISMKDRKFISYLDSNLEEDKEKYYLFGQNEDRKYSLILSSDFSAISENRYFYCGKVVNPDTGKLTSIFKERTVKGHLGYVNIDTRTRTTKNHVLGAEIEGFILIQTKKYLIYEGNVRVYEIYNLGPKHYLSKKERVIDWGAIISEEDMVHINSITDIKELNYKYDGAI